MNSFSQKDPLTLGELNFNYSTPVEYEIGPIRVIGADNYDHQGIKLIAGLRQGQKITLPFVSFGMKDYSQILLFMLKKKWQGSFIL